MQTNEAVPKDAAAVILLRENSNEVYLAQRNPQISFLGGYHAFPGGKVDEGDAQIEVRNCEDKDLAKFIVCAVRETFEEVGVLLVRGGEKITKGQRASLHDDLVSGRFSFAEILETWGLRIDAADFNYTGFWTTPKFSPVRFKTRFFLAVCPKRQEPQTYGEFVLGEYTAPRDALELWKNSQILIAPPVLITIQHLAETDIQNLPAAAEKLLGVSSQTQGEIRHIKLNPFITVFPVRTETLPPATHTNCFIAGEKEFLVIDPGSPFADEQRALNDYLDSLIENEGILREIILTHLHKDHTSGAVALQKHFREKHRLSVPIAAHSVTAESVKDSVNVERFIEDEEIIRLKSNNDEKIELKAMHTPGHARGHLCFYNESQGFLLAGDNVLGTGSILIDSPEGNMIDYLQSLERMKDLPNLRFLCGSHGAAVFNAKEKIESYIAHRRERERKILGAIEQGAKNTREIVEMVYTDVSPELWNLAEKSVEAHLEKIRMEKTRLSR
jgi:glyoxylase-like metal-dependent hydrolase (beta-lactamase superfamily II)/8-oxo-dGTP pyrophosphatase MutT (NUDIX family)